MMPSHREAFSLDAFRNILKREQSKGFNNTSVFGGVDKFTKRWHDQIRDALGKGVKATRLLERPYSEMSVKGRTSWVASCLSLIDGPQSTLAEAPATTEQRPSKEKVSPSKRASRAKPPATLATGSIDQSVTKLSRVDTKTAEKLERLDVSTIRDLLYLFPRRHNDYSQQCKISNLKRGQPVTVIATVWEASQTRMGKSGKLKATQAVVGDETGNYALYGSVNHTWPGS